ncbi:MAG TPA: hypothetical protein VHF22_08425, partial [Planctomycetota bacterium]|nr:hypothetical protein [Planctomycetota bacterium]
MRRLAGPVAAGVAAIAFVLWGSPLWAERAERATLAPLVALAVAAALMPALRTRRAGLKIAAIALLGTVLSGVVHYAGTVALGWRLIPVEVAWTALFYTGMIVPVAGVCA